MTRVINCKVLRATILAATVALVGANGGAVRASEAKSELWAIARGGQLYDKWWEVLEKEKPTTTHPAYPANGKKKGAATWRCKECHGWDYKGKNGAYAKGSHFTGIKGVLGAKGRSPRELARIIRDKSHGYGKDLLPDEEVERLALFLSRGLIETDGYIDRGTKKVRGDVRRGAALYETICAKCHGLDGKQINFGDEKKPEYVGTIAAENPWEVLHKIRFGNPMTEMPALVGLDLDDQLAILAYTATLPAN